MCTYYFCHKTCGLRCPYRPHFTIERLHDFLSWFEKLSPDCVDVIDSAERVSETSRVRAPEEIGTTCVRDVVSEKCEAQEAVSPTDVLNANYGYETVTVRWRAGRALANFEADSWGEEYLALKRGDHIKVAPGHEDGWAWAEKNSIEGWVPQAFVQFS